MPKATSTKSYQAARAPTPPTQGANADCGAPSQVASDASDASPQSGASRVPKRIRTSKPKPRVQCPLCKEWYAGDLKRHMDTHKAVRRFRCQYCGRPCTQKSNLRAHEKTHTEVAELYFCHFASQGCTFTCTHRSSRTRHHTEAHNGYTIKGAKEGKPYRDTLPAPRKYSRKPKPTPYDRVSRTSSSSSSSSPSTDRDDAHPIASGSLGLQLGLQLDPAFVFSQTPPPAPAQAYAPAHPANPIFDAVVPVAGTWGADALGPDAYFAQPTDAELWMREGAPEVSPTWAAGGSVLPSPPVAFPDPASVEAAYYASFYNPSSPSAPSSAPSFASPSAPYFPVPSPYNNNNVAPYNSATPYNSHNASLVSTAAPSPSHSRTSSMSTPPLTASSSLESVSSIASLDGLGALQGLQPPQLQAQWQLQEASQGLSPLVRWLEESAAALQGSPSLEDLLPSQEEMAASGRELALEGFDRGLPYAGYEQEQASQEPETGVFDMDAYINYGGAPASA